MINAFLKTMAFVVVAGVIGNCAGDRWDVPSQNQREVDPGAPLVHGIPLDGKATLAPVVPLEGNVVIPNFKFSFQEECGYEVINLSFPGIPCPINPGNWMKFSGTETPDQNIWLTIDGKPKGISAYNNSDGWVPFFDDRCRCSFIPDVPYFPTNDEERNSFVISFVNEPDLCDGASHEVTITIRSKNCEVFGMKTFIVVFDGSGSDDELVPGIPGDGQATVAPEISDPNVVVPNFNYSIEDVDGVTVINFNMNGIQDPNSQSEWLRLIGTGDSDENLWLTIDELPKGFAVINTIDEIVTQTPAVDLVFLVDNSGSMSQEADAVARDITDWAAKLSQTLDIKFGCVGYDGRIRGAVDITTADDLRDYLNRSSVSGTSRTVGFWGENAATLQSAVSPYTTSGECGAAALRFADENFTFRTGANRIYVNFTDEYNQPGGNPEYSVEWVQDATNWNATKGTIHTVYSNGTSTERQYYSEKPWILSEATGGTTLMTNSSFTGVTLDDLPVTGALQNSYVLRVTNIEDLFDGQPHTVKITIYWPDGTIRGEKIVQVVFNK